MSVKKTEGELELLRQQLKSLESGKQQPGSYGRLLSSGTPSKVAKDKLKTQIQAHELKLKKLKAAK